MRIDKIVAYLNNMSMSGIIYNDINNLLCRIFE